MEGRKEGRKERRKGGEEGGSRRREMQGIRIKI
jgi:hypothetical protein